MGMRWRKASRSSNNGGNCVETARVSKKVAAVRDSKQPQGGTLMFTPDAFCAFLEEVKQGKYDL